MATTYMETKRPSFSLFSIAAVVCAVLSFASAGALGLLLAGIAILAGVLGAVVALLPGTRGGFVSFFAVVAGFVGIGAAIYKLIAGTTL